MRFLIVKTSSLGDVIHMLPGGKEFQADEFRWRRPPSSAQGRFAAAGASVKRPPELGSGSFVGLASRLKLAGAVVRGRWCGRVGYGRTTRPRGLARCSTSQWRACARRSRLDRVVAVARQACHGEDGLKPGLDGSCTSCASRSLSDPSETSGQ